MNCHNCGKEIKRENDPANQPKMEQGNEVLKLIAEIRENLRRIMREKTPTEEDKEGLTLKL